MPTWRIRTEGAPRIRKAYGGSTPSNAAAWAPTPLMQPQQAFGGDEVTYGAPRRLVPTGDPKMANYLPAEQIPSRWAAAVAWASGVLAHPALYDDHDSEPVPSHAAHPPRHPRPGPGADEGHRYLGAH